MLLHTHTHTHTRKDSTHTVSSFLFFMSILVYALKTGPYHRPIYLLLFSHQVMSNFVTHRQQHARLYTHLKKKNNLIIPYYGCAIISLILLLLVFRFFK